MDISYQEFLPSRKLQPFIDCYWYEVVHGSPNEMSNFQTCIPLGMAEAIVQISNLETFGCIQNKWQYFPEAYLIGIKKFPVTWQAPGGSHFFGIRLKPEGLLQLFNLSLADFTDSYVEVSEFMGSSVKNMVANIRQASHVEAMIGSAEGYFLSLLPQIKLKKHYLLDALRLIRQSDGNMSIENLSRQLFVCERQLQRSFKVNLGLTPKAYHRIIRFRQAYYSIFQNQSVNWADIANGYNYADQAHFIRDFKTFCGKTPVAFLDEYKTRRQVLIHCD